MIFLVVANELKLETVECRKIYFSFPKKLFKKVNITFILYLCVLPYFSKPLNITNSKLV